MQCKWLPPVMILYGHPPAIEPRQRPSPSAKKGRPAGRPQRMNARQPALLLVSQRSLCSVRLASLDDLGSDNAECRKNHEDDDLLHVDPYVSSVRPHYTAPGTPVLKRDHEDHICNPHCSVSTHRLGARCEIIWSLRRRKPHDRRPMLSEQPQPGIWRLSPLGESDGNLAADTGRVPRLVTSNSPTPRNRAHVAPTARRTRSKARKLEQHTARLRGIVRRNVA